MCVQLVHHMINYRLTVITEAQNLIAPRRGLDCGRTGRGVDHQLQLDWITSKRLKRRVLRIDIDFKNAVKSMSQSKFAVGSSESPQFYFLFLQEQFKDIIIIIMRS